MVKEIEKYLKKCPCINCLTLVICRGVSKQIGNSKSWEGNASRFLMWSTHYELEKGILTQIGVTFGLKNVLNKCSELREYISNLQINQHVFSSKTEKVKILKKYDIKHYSYSPEFYNNRDFLLYLVYTEIFYRKETFK